jgi:MFS family permease
VIFTSVPLVVAETSIGTAYGIIAGFFGLGLMVDPIVVGYLVDIYSWRAAYLYFSISTFLGLCFMIAIEVLDCSEGKFRIPVVASSKRDDYVEIIVR